MIFYFSATGNSKYVVSRISKITGDEIFGIDSCTREKNLTFKTTGNENIDIVVSVFTGALPIIVDDLFNKVDLSRESKGHNFAVVTYRLNTGAADYYLKNKMTNKALPLYALFSVKYPDSFTPLFNVSNKEKVQKKVKEAEPQIDYQLIRLKTKSKVILLKKSPWTCSSYT
jgi:flavodoxin